jgi:hypothetical protein
MLVYDIEIKKAIPSKNGPRLPDIEYCEGWRDHANMGIAVLGAYDYVERRARIFMKDNLDEFVRLTEQHDVIVGFNSIAFDNKIVLAELGVDLTPKSYDILVELWRGAGLAPVFNFRTHGGFGLDAACKANFDTEKTGNGALAPVDFQRGNFGTVVDYCLNDVRLTCQLLDRIIAYSAVADPRNPKNSLTIQRPAVPASV